MAVSGRKTTTFSGSISKSSAEDFDHSCEPCLAIGQDTEAHRFCVECQQYLCQNCIAYHHRITATKNHQLLDKDNMIKQTPTNKDTTVYSEKCTIHRNEHIKFFCTNHELLGCNDCITLNHRTCKIDYIPDNCADIWDSQEYRKTLKEIDQKIKDMDAIIEKAQQQDQETDLSHDSLYRQILKFRKEINDHLDLLQKKLVRNAEKQKHRHKDTIAKVLHKCTSVSTDMKKLKSILQDSKTSQENGKTYIFTKQAQSKLKTDYAETAKESLEKADIQYIFERNKELQDVFTKQYIFGSLKKTIDYDKLSPRGNINVRTKSDKHECWITGSVVLSSDKVVLADWENSKLKVVDIKRKLVSEEKKLDSKPWDIAVLPQDQIAVTIPDKREILLLTTCDELSIIQKIPVSKGECKGITYHQDKLYVVCWNPNSVLITDIRGNVRETILLENEIFSGTNFILLSKESGHIYVSNYGSNSVVSVSLQGDISAVYEHQDLKGSVGMVILDDGSLLVCCGNGTTHHISGDLKQGQPIRGGLKYPYSICYDQHERKIYICGNSDQLMIMK